MRRILSAYRRCLLASLALLGAAMADPAGAQAIVAFHLPASPAAACLGTLGAQAGVTIAGDAGLVAGVRCAAVTGKMTVGEALTRALQDSSVIAIQLAPTVFRIVARPAPPAAPPSAPATAEPVWPEIVVVAHSPVLWRVTRGDAEIVILGSVAPMPARLDWNMARVRRHLTGAKRLLIAPQPRAGLLRMDSWSARDAGGLFLPRGQLLEAQLPPALRDRFAAARGRAGQPAKRYAALRPAIAAMLLLDDWRRQAALLTIEPARTIEQLARRQHIAIQRIDPLSDLPTLDRLPDMPDPAQHACLDHILTNIEAEEEKGESQARAWSIGDIAGLRQSYLPPATCSDDIAGDRDRREKAMRDWSLALETALATPGRTFAVVDVTALLAPDGIVARLRSLGAEVTLIGN